MIIEPTRVVVDDGGLGTTPIIAERQYGITPTIIFLRDDQWSLGAPSEFERVAYEMWQGNWTHFARTGDTSWQSITNYVSNV